MRRPTGRWTALVILFAVACFPAAAQQPPATDPPAGQPKPQSPAPNPPWWVRMPEVPPAPPAPPPEEVFVPEGTEFNVILDTPLSTRMTKKGESVTFLLAEPVDVGDGLEIPPDTRITGTVTEAKRPGIFSRAGKLKVKIEQIELPTGGDAAITARLESGDPANVRLKADSSRSADLYSLASWTLQGTLLGASVNGGKGAAYGAGAGAAAALIIMMSRRGPDLYLEPGMPFVVILDAPVELSGWDVQRAQTQYQEAQQSRPEATDEWSPGEDPELTTRRPKLKRRPK